MLSTVCLCAFSFDAIKTGSFVFVRLLFCHDFIESYTSFCKVEHA